MTAGHPGPLHLNAALARQWASTLAGDVVLPGDAPYEDARRVWNRAVDRHPAAIVRCAAADDVVRALAFAQAQGLAIAVRSGGHSQAGHGVGDGVVVIDLAGLHGVGVDRGRRIVRAGAGARVAGLLEAMRPHGLVTPTGGCPDVGIGGLTLGGGENLLMARHGAVCDNLLSAQMVLADGRVVTASDHENPDLFWAIRGGGGNFGIATSFEYRLHAVEQVLSGLLYFPVSRTVDVLSRYRDLMSAAPDDLQTAGGLIHTPGGPMLMVSFCYCGDTPRGDALAGRWRDALQPVKDSLALGPYGADFAMPTGPSTGSGAFLPVLNDEVIRILGARFADAPPEASAVWNDFHGAVTRIPVSATAFPLRSAGFDLFICAAWESDAARDAAHAWVAGLRASLRPFTGGVYVNNLENEGADRVRDAYGPNYDRLAALKTAYDPGNVFHLNQNIVPAR